MLAKERSPKVHRRINLCFSIKSPSSSGKEGPLVELTPCSPTASRHGGDALLKTGLAAAAALNVGDYCNGSVVNVVDADNKDEE